jgi:hypothetical protein
MENGEERISICMAAIESFRNGCNSKLNQTQQKKKKKPTYF